MEQVITGRKEEEWRENEREGERQRGQEWEGKKRGRKGVKERERDI